MHSACRAYNRRREEDDPIVTAAPETESPGRANSAAGLAGTRPRTHGLTQAVFWIGFLLFAVGRISQSLVPDLARAEPAEIDDAYRYLAQARVMAACFSGDCPALRSIQRQLDHPGTSEDLAFNRLRTDIHLFTYFHPLVSLALNGARGMGVEPSSAYRLVSLSLGMMVVVALGLWQRSVWGPAPAGIALLLLAFYPLPGQGLHFVPGTIALGWAALTWPAILEQRRRAYAILPFLWLASLAAHSMALFYVTASLLMVGGLAYPRLGRPERRLLLAGLVLLAGRLWMGIFVPQFSLTGNTAGFYPESPAWTEAILLGLGDLWDWVVRWGATYWRTAAAALLVGGGLASAAAPHRRRMVVSGLALCAVLAASLVYHHPVHGSTATGRIWGCLAVFLAGAIGSGIVFLLRRSWVWLTQVRTAGSRPAALWLQGAVLLGLAGLTLRMLATNLRYSATAYPAAVQRATSKDNLRLGAAEPFLPVLSLAQEQVVVYLDEVSLYAGLANGMHAVQAVYPPILTDPGTERERAIAEARPTFAVGLSPLRGLSLLERGAIALRPGTSLEVEGPAMPGTEWDSVRVINRGEDAVMVIISTDAEQARREEVLIPAGTTGWQQLPGWLASTQGFTLGVESIGQGLAIEGLRLNGPAQTNWPWDHAIRLRALDPGNSDPADWIELTTSGWSKDTGLRLQVVGDADSIVLARVLR
jgi:hypothetical protein